MLLVVKNLPANAGNTRDMDLIPGWGRFPGGGHGNHSSILPRESHGQRSLTGYSPQGHKESDMMKQLSMHTTPLSSCMYGMVFLLFSAQFFTLPPFASFLLQCLFFATLPQLPFLFCIALFFCSKCF